METETCTPKQSTCCCKRRVCAAVCLFLFVFAGIACWYVHHPNRPRQPIDPKPGTRCTVQFRRGDALGSGADIPVNPATNIINGAVVSMNGTLVAINHEAIILERVNVNRTEYESGEITIQTNTDHVWIPKSSILLIQYKIQEAQPTIQ